MKNLLTHIDVSDPWHPLKECLPDLIELIEEVSKQNYSFDKELKEIQAIKFVIDEHPEEAVAEFNELYGQVQAHQSRVSSILIEIYRQKSTWQRFFHRIKRIYRKGRNYQLTKNEDIKKLKNKELQEAQVQTDLREVCDIKELIENILEDFDLTIEIINIKREELERANMNLARQQKIVETLIGTGYPISHTRMQPKE